MNSLTANINVQNRICRLVIGGIRRKTYLLFFMRN